MSTIERILRSLKYKKNQKYIEIQKKVSVRSQWIVKLHVFYIDSDIDNLLGQKVQNKNDACYCIILHVANIFEHILYVVVLFFLCYFVRVFFFITVR